MKFAKRFESLKSDSRFGPISIFLRARPSRGESKGEISEARDERGGECLDSKKKMQQKHFKFSKLKEAHEGGRVLGGATRLVPCYTQYVLIW